MSKGQPGAPSTLLLYIAAGGALGALARHSVGEWITGFASDGFPWGTLSVNVAGALLLGVLVAFFPRSNTREEMRAGLTVGLCGGFTTFSTFAYETVSLVDQGSPGLAFSYALVSVIAGLAAMLLGLWLGAVRAHDGSQQGEQGPR